jgi:Xaa-Pro aminopeptidase
MDFKGRLALLKKSIKGLGLDSFLVTDDVNVSYLSGFTGSDSMLMITPKRSFFITDSRYMEEAMDSVSGFSFEAVKESTYKTLGSIVKAGRLKRMGFESANLPYAAVEKLKTEIPAIDAVPVRDAIEELRAVKEPSEIAAVKKSVSLTKLILGGVLKSIRRSDRERDLAGRIEVGFLEHGAACAFRPIVASGRNSSKPHASPGSSRIGANGFTMIDLGCKLNGYCADMTRTIVTGAVTDRFAAIYTVVRAAQKRAIDKIRHGVRAGEVDFAARGYIASMGYGKYFGHSVGHGVGMKIHEKPTVSRFNDSFLMAGMVLTVEPAIYIPGFGGVRIEDMVLVTDKGCEVLT